MKLASSGQTLEVATVYKAFAENAKENTKENIIKPIILYSQPETISEIGSLKTFGQIVAQNRPEKITIRYTLDKTDAAQYVKSTNQSLVFRCPSIMTTIRALCADFYAEIAIEALAYLWTPKIP